MGLSKNLKRIGMAAYQEKRDMQEALDHSPSTLTPIDKARITLNVAKKFYENMLDFRGENHPVTVNAKEELEKAQARCNELEGVTAPVIGYVQENRVTWRTDEIPASYVAVWDDNPEVTKFVKATAPGEGRGGQEAMKKPAEEIIQQ